MKKDGKGLGRRPGSKTPPPKLKDFESAQVLLKKSQEAERRYTERLAALVEISTELAREDTIDALCRKAVELGRSRLGFDRLGIWFRTEEPDVIAGSFGVDWDGEVCDERERRVKVQPDWPERQVILGEEPFVMIGEDPLVDSLGEVVGQASQIFAALWDGEKVIGHVSADNLVQHGPLVSHQRELLRLFGSVVGYQCTRQRTAMEREKLIKELQDALASIKTLRGLLPICAHCKRIRDDKGYWNRIEEYIQDHSEADFTHGLCPDCKQELYPELESGKKSP